MKNKILTCLTALLLCACASPPPPPPVPAPAPPPCAPLIAAEPVVVHERAAVDDNGALLAFQASARLLKPADLARALAEADAAPKTPAALVRKSMLVAVQQLRDAERRNEQLTDKLDALKNIERALSVRAPTPTMPASAPAPAPAPAPAAAVAK